jgi:phosphoadenosine phosphosulfate reductase
MERIRNSELQRLNEELAGAGAEEILSAAWERWGNGLGMTTAFGYSGVYLMYLLRKLGLAPEIYFIDTGYHFAETYSFAEQIKRIWELPIRTIGADEEIREYVRETLGPRPWEHNANLCCHYLKVAPLLAVLPEKDAWLSSLRRDQSPTRSAIDVFQLDSRGTLKVHPLARYSSEEIWREIRSAGLPYHPLHDEGYLSIGCEPCTAPVSRGEHERAGRWSGSGKLECGLHL